MLNGLRVVRLAVADRPVVLHVAHGSLRKSETREHTEDGRFSLRESKLR